MQRDDSRIQVVLVEDESLYRDLLRIVLSQHSRLEVVGAYGDPASALAEVPRLAPRVAILDIDLRSDMDGIQLGLRLRRSLPNMGIVLLSNHGNPQFVASLPLSGQTGWSYLLKKSVSDADALARAVEGAASGLVVLDPQLVAGMHPRTGGQLSRLTPRQREILGLIAQGLTNAAIAERLVLTEKTVANQTNLMYEQLDMDHSDSSAHPRVKAVLMYLEENRFRGTDVTSSRGGPGASR